MPISAPKFELDAPDRREHEAAHAIGLLGACERAHFPRHRRFAVGDALVLDQAVYVVPDRRLELRLLLLEIEHLHVRRKPVEGGVERLSRNSCARGFGLQGRDTLSEVRARRRGPDEGGKGRKAGKSEAFHAPIIGDSRFAVETARSGLERRRKRRGDALSITIGRFGGTAVKIHITFVLFLAWIAFSAWSRGGPAAALDGTLFIVLLFACVVPHEFDHIAAANRYGISTSEVTLSPIGGVASLQRLPSDPAQEPVVALAGPAGPAVNLVIGLTLIVLIGSAYPGDLAQINNPNLLLLSGLAIANIFLRWTAGAFCTRWWRCGSAVLVRATIR